MKRGLYGQLLTLTDELKVATFGPHVRLQEVPYFQVLVACQLPLESYVGQLRAWAALHGVLEAALAASTHPALAAVWRADLQKVPLLQQDLRYFEPRAVADLREAAEESLRAVEQLRLLALQQPVALLGWLYVLEGSTLGAQVLRPQLVRAFLLPDADGLAYFSSYGPAVHAHWAGFQQRMNDLRLTPAEAAHVAAAATECFNRLRGIILALYPFQPESKTYLVTSINAEAGRHPIPTDPREVEAALRASERCWARFPYFEARYGERGRRFARSDGAWLASLCQFEPTQIHQQVRWLGHVLATRGMPTLLLQVQLEILGEELAAVRPERTAEYEKLLRAAAQLHATRAERIGDAPLAALAHEFDQAVGPEWSRRLPDAGRLLAAAVADERSGYPGTVASLIQWLADPTRFPAAWIAAVQATLAQAEGQAPSPS
jgi:heme oxygenase